MTSPLDTIKGAILGVPFDPNKKPSRQGTVQAFAEMQVQLEGAQAGALVKDTLANLNALASVSEASIMAWVTNDPTQANNGIYENTGTDVAPVWTRRIDIPQFVISGINVGAGTADAIQATTDLPIPIQDGRTLIIVNIVADNTGAMTLSLNGGAALPILSVSGNAMINGTVLTGMNVAGFISGGNFYLITDVASASIVAAAAASAAAALVSENNAATSESNAADSETNAANSAAAADVAKIEWQGAWVTTTVYDLNDAVEEAGSSYICIIAHTAGVFATDLGAGKWELLAQKGIGDLVASNNLSDIANAITAFNNIKQAATTTVTGVVEKATPTEALDGTEVNKYADVVDTRAANAMATWVDVEDTYDFAVDGSVASVESALFEDGFEHRFKFEAVTMAAIGPLLTELYKETDATYLATGHDTRPTVSTGSKVWGFIELLSARISSNRHYAYLEARSNSTMTSTGEAKLTLSLDNAIAVDEVIRAGFYTLTTAQKLSKARFSGTGNLNGGKIIMQKRRAIT